MRTAEDRQFGDGPRLPARFSLATWLAALVLGACGGARTVGAVTSTTSTSTIASSAHIVSTASGTSSTTDGAVSTICGTTVFTTTSTLPGGAVTTLMQTSSDCATSTPSGSTCATTTCAPCPPKQGAACVPDCSPNGCRYGCPWLIQANCGVSTWTTYALGLLTSCAQDGSATPSCP